MKSKLTKDLLKFSEEDLMPSISDKRRTLEILSVVLTAIGKFIFMDFLDWRLYYVVVAILSWSIYILSRYKQEKDILRYWGFRFDNLKTTFNLMFPFGFNSIFYTNWLLSKYNPFKLAYFSAFNCLSNMGCYSTVFNNKFDSWKFKRP